MAAGERVAKYIRQTSPYNTQIVALGIDTYLKMLLHDNFVVSLQPLDSVPAQHPSGYAMEGLVMTWGHHLDYTC